MSIKRFRSVIQSTAHHAVSGLCYVHPHLGIACKEQRVQSLTINLLKPSYDPQLANETREIEHSTNALREKFLEIVSAEKLCKSDISAATITFQFIRTRWPDGCYVYLETVDGKHIDVAVDAMGHSAEILQNERISRRD